MPVTKVKDSSLSAENAVVRFIHITKFHTFIHLNTGKAHIFAHKNDKDVKEELVVSLTENGTRCMDAWEGEAGGELEKTKEDWIVVGGERGYSEGTTAVQVYYWDRTGNLVEKFKLQGHRDTVIVLKALSATTVISASFDKTIRIWNIHRGTCEAILEGHTDPAVHLDVHENIAVSATYSNEARIWDLEKRVCLHVLRCSQTVSICAIITNGVKVFMGASDSTLSIWDVTTGRIDEKIQCTAPVQEMQLYLNILQMPLGRTMTSMLSADASGVIRLFASGNDLVTIWKVKAHQCLVAKSQRTITSMERHGDMIASGGSDGLISVWDSKNNKLKLEVASNYRVCQVKWIGDSLVAVAAIDPDIREKARITVSVTVLRCEMRGILK